MKQKPTKISGVVKYAHDRLLYAMKWVEKIPGHRLEWAALLFYIGLVGLVMVFHEPWSDEAQAWQIARCASLREILLQIPHYEGHPPLWHLILMPFAKLGVPFEWGIKLPNLAINAVAVALLLWKSPFPRLVKLLLPFTYFLFYQYGVISRPYCIVFLALMLCALFYKDKNEKPFCFCGALALLCLSTLYGLVLAGGICLVWLYELWKGKSFAAFLKSFLHSRSMIALLLLFLLALGTVITLFPTPETFAIAGRISQLEISNYLLNLLYMLVVAPSDALFLESGFRFDDVRQGVTIFNLVYGAIFFALMLRFARLRRVLLLFTLPYLLFSLLGAGYLYAHHLGIITLFVLFVAWCGMVRQPDPEPFFAFVKLERDRLTLRHMGVLLSTALFIVPLSWTVTSSVNDLLFSYGSERASAAFLKQHGLDSERYSLMIGWRIPTKEEEEEGYLSTIDYNVLEAGVGEMAYLGKNIFYNFNGGQENLAYYLHKPDSSEETREALASHGMPDLYYGHPAFDLLWEEPPAPKMYFIVASFEGNSIFKSGRSSYYINVSASQEVVDALGLEPLYF